MGKTHPLMALALNLALQKFFPPVAQEQPQVDAIPELADIPPVRQLKHKEGAVVLVLGRRESGKTILSQRLAQIIGRPTFAISPEQKPPPWITELKLEELTHEPPPWSTLLCDDLPAYLSSHDYSNALAKTLEHLIPVCRHRRKLCLVFLTQSAAMSDKYVLDSDLIFFKPLNLLFQDLERPAVARLYKAIGPLFDRMTEAERRRHAFLLSPDWRGLVRINLPDG